LNPRQADYDSDALPTELFRLYDFYTRVIYFFTRGN
jgi:hypothetical protein